MAHTQTTKELIASAILRLSEKIEFKRQCIKHESFKEFAQATEIEIESLQLSIEFLRKALIEG